MSLELGLICYIDSTVVRYIDSIFYSAMEIGLIMALLSDKPVM